MCEVCVTRCSAITTQPDTELSLSKSRWWTERVALQLVCRGIIIIMMIYHQDKLLSLYISLFTMFDYKNLNKFPAPVHLLYFIYIHVCISYDLTLVLHLGPWITVVGCLMVLWALWLLCLSSLFFKAFTVSAIVTPSIRLCHTFTTPWHTPCMRVVGSVFLYSVSGLRCGSDIAIYAI